MQRGYFITFEGIEGAGKSTVIKFIADYLRAKQIDLVITREPGGTEIAEKIRKVVLDHNNEPMHPDTEILLYFAGRAQHLHQVILPALEQGQWVLCDRFTDATYAYQSGGRGIPFDKIRILEDWVQQGLKPDYTLLLDVDVTVGMSRIKHNRVLDRFEVEEHAFFEKVRACYLTMAQQEPQRYYIINANLEPELVLQQIREFLQKIISN